MFEFQLRFPRTPDAGHWELLRVVRIFLIPDAFSRGANVTPTLSIYRWPSPPKPTHKTTSVSQLAFRLAHAAHSGPLGMCVFDQC